MTKIEFLNKSHDILHEFMQSNAEALTDREKSAICELTYHLWYLDELLDPRFKEIKSEGQIGVPRYGS